VGRLVPYAVGSPGSFAGQVRRLSGIEGFHVHQMRHYAASRIMPSISGFPTSLKGFREDGT